MRPEAGSDSRNMENGIPEGNKGMAPKTEHIAGHSVSWHVLEKMVGNRFGKAGSRKKLESQVRQVEYIQMGKIFKF